MKAELKKLPKSEMEIEFELTEDEFARYFEQALEHLKKHVKIDGFRPGQAPAKIAEDKIRPESLLMEAGDMAVRETYSKYVQENNLEPIGHPEISVVKIAKGSPFVFKAKFAVLPPIELPDYKEIASKIKVKDIAVTEEEVQDALNYLQKSRAKMSAKDKDGAAEKGDFVQISYQNKDTNSGKEIDDQFIVGEAGFVKGFEDNIFGMKAGEEKSFNLPEKGDFKLKVKAVFKMDLPQMTDDFAKQLGAFDSLVALKKNIQEGMTQERKEEEKQRRRAEVLQTISEKATIELPNAMVNYEKERLLEDFKHQVSHTFSAQGGPASDWEQYLATTKQTEEQLKNTFQKEAEKRLRGFLVLKEIGERENVRVSDEELEEVMNKNLKNYPGKNKIDINQLKEYTKGVLFNEKVFNILENN